MGSQRPGRVGCEVPSARSQAVHAQWTSLPACCACTRPPVLLPLLQVERLSGGEKARLALAKFMLTQVRALACLAGIVSVCCCGREVRCGVHYCQQCRLPPTLPCAMPVLPGAAGHAVGAA